MERKVLLNEPDFRETRLARSLMINHGVEIDDLVGISGLPLHEHFKFLSFVLSKFASGSNGKIGSEERLCVIRKLFLDLIVNKRDPGESESSQKKCKGQKKKKERMLPRFFQEEEAKDHLLTSCDSFPCSR